MLTIFNCGQGDASKIESDGCVFDSTHPLYIDLGPSRFTCSITSQRINLLITHSHNDHMCGGFSNNNFVIDTLFIPAYFPEIYKILSKLLKKQFVTIQKKPKHTQILFEGSKFGGCRHIEVFNPPLDPKEIFSKKNITDISQQDIDLFLEQNDTSVNDIINQDTPFSDVLYPEGYSDRNFIMIAVNIIKQLTENGNVPLEDAINKFLEFDANKISIVFKYYTCFQNEKFAYLMTGDADCSVFERLIKKNKCLKSDILKVPHHGSKNNLNKNILSKISPSVAVISHDNGKFGNAKDTHPNIEVIDILEKSGVSVYYTNDVKKNNRVIKCAHHGLIPNTNVCII